MGFRGWAALACALVLSCASARAATTAEVARGLTWLQAQVAADGSIAGEANSVAPSAQLRTEVARTLRELGREEPAGLLQSLSLDTEPITEVLSRAVLATTPGGQAASSWMAALLARQLPDGSQPSSVGYAPTDIDMAWALRAMVGQPTATPLSQALVSRQHADGSWRSTPYAPLHASALALCGLSPYASSNADAARAATAAAAYLTAQRLADGSWSQAVWLTAQVYECLHDFLPSQEDHSRLRDWLLARQAADGGWEQDPFVTALALRALSLAAQPPLNPLQSGLRVRLVDGQTGAALSGVTVALAGSANVAGATDGSGSFQQTTLPPGSYQLTASYSGYTSVSVALSLKAGVVADVGSLRMSRTSTTEATTASVSGVATDANNGQSLPGVLVTIAGAGKSALTDAQGRYSIDALTPGAYGISASKSGYSTAATSFSAAAGGSYSFSPRLPLIATGGDDAAGCRIYGKLLKATDSTPVTGATVTLSGVNAKVTTSDATGAYVLPGLVSGSTTIRVAATGYDTVQATAVLSCGTPAANEFSPRLYPTATSPTDANTASLTFRVIDSTSGSALPGVAVAVTATGQSARTLTSAADGRVVIDQLPLASVQVQLSLAGYDGVTLGATITAPQPSDIGAVPMKKSRSAVVTGIVTQAVTGAPLEGASVVLSGATSAQATTDSAGRFMLAGLLAGAHTVTIGKTGFVGTSSTFDAAPGGEYVVSPRLQAATGEADPVGCRLAGTIKAAQGGAAIAGAQITLTGANAQTATTDAAGAYSLNGLVSGNTRVVVSASGFDGAMFNFRLGCSKPNTTDFSPKLYPAGQSPVNANTASVTFTLLDAAKGSPLVAVPVTATPEGQPARIVTTATNGRFTVAGLQQAEVQIQATVAGYEPLDLSFQVTPLQDTDMGQLRLRPAGITPLLPDLRVQSVSRASAITDPQSLVLSGTVQATVVNQGLASTDRAVTLLAFEDRNRNGRYDAEVDAVLGQATLRDLLAVGQSATVGIPVSGSLLFRDAPIHAWVDSKEELAEKDEANNMRSTADAAQVQPAIGTFRPVLKWHWDGSSSPFPSYNQVMMSPVVGRFVDTNGDGKIDSSDVPVVVFVSFRAGGGAYDAGGVIRAVNGRTGAELLTIKDTSNPVAGISGLALADLDNDGKPELIAMTLDFRVVAYRGDGSTLWVSEKINPPESNAPWGGPTVADIDGDGSPEIIYGRTVLDARGKLKWRGAGAYSGSTITGQSAAAVSIVADLFGTGQQNLIVGASVYSPSGELKWQARDGYAAVADFEGGGEPSIAVVNAGTVSLYTRSGQLRWSVSLPGSGRGGPPTIADVDGDGIPDIGVAASNAYTVFRADGSVLWSHSSQDGTSQMTGSTVFDFNGDESAEVLYADETRIRAFRGTTGEILWEIPNSSGTAIEYPLAVDVDGDGHADLVTVANDYYTPANATVLLHGVRVYQDQNNGWVNTRQLWNQHAYSITNINDDLTVPARPTSSWTAHNTYRANKRIDGASTAVADLTTSLLRVADKGPQGRATFSVRIGNGGGLAAPPGVKVAFYGVSGSGPTLLGVVGTPEALGAGGFVDLSIDIAAGLAQFTQLTVVADDDGTGKQSLADFDRSNNTLSVDVAPLATALSLSLATDAPTYQAGQSARFMATVTNGGSFAKAGRVRYLVQTVDGQPVAALPMGATFSVPLGASSSDQATWNVGNTYAGNFHVSADLLDAASDRVLASASASFAIQAGDVTGASLLVATLQLDKGSYNPGDALQLIDRVTNLATNMSWQGLVVQTTVRNPDGTARWSDTATLDELAASGMREKSYSVALSNAPAGVYEARIQVLDANGAQLAEAVKTFKVTSTASTGVGLTGYVAVLPKPVFKGGTASLAFHVSNQGNSDIATLPLRVDIVAPDAEQRLATMPATVALAKGATYSSNTSWTANVAVGTQLVAMLIAQVEGRDLTLAQESFSVTEATMQIGIESSVDPDTRLLVLVTCPPAMLSPTCMSDRVAAIKSVLEGASAMAPRGLPYKIVTTATEFENEFHCGIYNSYWISSGTESLSDTLVKELREAVRRGEQLLIDGRQVTRDTLLHSVAGVLQQGVQSGASLTVNLGSPFVGSALNASGPGVNYALTSAQVSSWFADGTPAIASNAYGNGKAWVFAFDLPGTLIQSASNAATMTQLRSGLSNVLTEPRAVQAALTLGDIALLDTRVNNPNARPVVVEWRVQLPVGIELVSSNLTPTLLQQSTDQAAGQGVWRATLPVDGAQRLYVRLKATKVGVPLDVPVLVYSIAESGDATLQHVQTHQLATVTSEELGLNAIAAVRALAPAVSADIQARDRALTAINQARSSPDVTTALPLWITAADELRSITTASATTLADAQLATAWGAEAGADAICPILKTLQACIGGGMSLVGGNTIPLNETRRANVSLLNSCTFDLTNVAYTVRFVNRRIGSPVQISGPTAFSFQPRRYDPTTSEPDFGAGSFYMALQSFTASSSFVSAGDYVDVDLELNWRGQRWPVARTAILVGPPVAP